MPTCPRRCNRSSRARICSGGAYKASCCRSNGDRSIDATHTIRLDAGTTKNKRGRVVNYSDNTELSALIAALWAQHEGLAAKHPLCPWVFQRNGRQIKTFRRAWVAACADAGYPGYLLPDLRRSAVRNLVRSGTPDTVAMKITGHKTRRVFDRFDISSEADVREGSDGSRRPSNR